MKLAMIALVIILVVGVVGFASNSGAQPLCPDGAQPRFLHGRFVCPDRHIVIPGFRTEPLQRRPTVCQTMYFSCPLGYGEPRMGDRCFCPDSFGFVVYGIAR